MKKMADRAKKNKQKKQKNNKKKQHIYIFTLQLLQNILANFNQTLQEY